MISAHNLKGGGRYSILTELIIAARTKHLSPDCENNSGVWRKSPPSGHYIKKRVRVDLSLIAWILMIKWRHIKISNTGLLLFYVAAQYPNKTLSAILLAVFQCGFIKPQRNRWPGQLIFLKTQFCQVGITAFSPFSCQRSVYIFCANVCLKQANITARFWFSGPVLKYTTNSVTWVFRLQILYLETAICPFRSAVHCWICGLCTTRGSWILQPELWWS